MSQLTEEEYFKNRLDDQIKWYNKKSAINKNYYIRFKIAVIIMAALVPFFTGNSYLAQGFRDVFVGLLGVAIAALSGISTLLKFQENWTKYRMAAEALIHEKFLYQTGSGYYKDLPDAFQEFVDRIEQILSKENTDWFKNSLKKE